jgi:DUF1009 family protein
VTLSGAGAYQSAPLTAADKSPVAIICGGGAFPAAVADAVQKHGRSVHLFLLEGFADPALARYPHEWVKLGSLAKYAAARKRHDLRDIVFIGSVVRPRIRHLGLDWRALMLLPRIARMYLGGDNSLLSGVSKIFEENGFRLRGAHEVAPEILMPEGLATNLKPAARDSEDIAVGLELLRTIGRFDVGQAAVIAGRRVVAIEGAEGTEGLLARTAEMRRNGRLKLGERDGVLVKIPKPSQDRRFDLPAIGIDTVAQARAAGLSGIAVEAGGALVLDAQKFIEAAEAAGLFVAVLPAAGRSAS